MSSTNVRKVEQMNINFGERLKEFRTKLNLSQPVFAEAIGISTKTLWNYENDKREIPTKLILQIRHLYGLNLDWLISGLGEMLGDKSNNCFKNFEEISLDKPLTTDKKDNDDCINIRARCNVNASMGCGTTVYDEKTTCFYSISRSLIGDIGVSQNNLEIIFAQGDSMMPTITSGDSLIIDITKKDIYDGKIYCVRIDGQLYAKRLQKIPPSIVNVLSDNIQYESFKIDFSKKIDFDFEVIGEVRWSGRVFN